LVNKGVAWYQIPKNHSFNGGKVPLLQALDDAMAWIGQSLTAP